MEHLETNGPSMTMLQIVGEFFADGNVSGDASVQEVEREFAEKCSQGRFEGVKVVQYGRAHLQMETGAPSTCLVWYDK